jgi:hypothetical protein
MFGGYLCRSFDIIRWGVVALAFGVSGLFMAINLKGVVGESKGSGGGFVFCCLMNGGCAFRACYFIQEAVF